MAMWVTLTGFGGGPDQSALVPIDKIDILRHGLTVGRPWIASLPAVAGWTHWGAPPPLVSILHPLERQELAGLNQVLSAHIEEPIPGGQLQMSGLFRSLVQTDRGQASGRAGMAVASTLAQAVLTSAPTLHVEHMIRLGLLSTASRKRPDLIAWHSATGTWAVLEAKGFSQARVQPAQLSRGKAQATSVSTVLGSAPSLCCLSAALLGPQTATHPIRAHLHDPEPADAGGELTGDPDELLAEHYGFFARALSTDGVAPRLMPAGGSDYWMFRLPGGTQVGLDFQLFQALQESLERGRGPATFASIVRGFMSRFVPFERGSEQTPWSIGDDGIAFSADPEGLD